ncbi:hypothetical protein RFF05_11645 [Bengtsoniella intestinalis]|uniref:DUF6809 family protein n=1 Tax=Bengtsoniella intestinalis TaxID=3073143 RepID=UPI00391F7DDA
MEEKIIQALYHGNLDPANKSVVRGSDYAKQLSILDSTVDTLRETISPEEKELLDKVLSTWMTMESIWGETRFVEGYKLGARLMLEVFMKGDSQFVDIWE